MQQQRHEMGVAAAVSAPTTSYRKIVFQSTSVASHFQLCKFPESFLWLWGVLSEHAMQARSSWLWVGMS